MKFEDKHSFNKPASTVMTMFSDRAYFERKYKDLGFTGIEVLEHEKSDKRFRIKVRYIAKNDVQVPDVLKKFMPTQITVVQEDSWDLTRKVGRLDVEIKGTPVKVSADMTLKDEDKGCANHLKWTVSCSLPLVGGKLEKLTADDIRAKAGKDVATTLRILTDY